jgi:hypothetical protein
VHALNSVFDVCVTLCVRVCGPSPPTPRLSAWQHLLWLTLLPVLSFGVVLLCVCCLSSPSVNYFGRMACLSSMGWLAPVVTLVVGVTCAPLATWRMTLPAGVKLTMFLCVLGFVGLCLDSAPVV